MSEGKHPSRTKRLALRIFGHPGVVAPAVGAGIVAATAMVVASPWIILGAAALGAASIGVGAYRLLFQKDKIANEFIDEERRLAEEKKEATVRAERDSLDTLHQRLLQDDDERDERIFNDLRRLVDGFSHDQAWFKRVNPEIVRNLSEKVDMLFRQCLDLLERSVDLRDMTSSLQTAARADLERSREELLREAGQGVQRLSQMLADVQTLGIRLIAESGKASIQDITDRIALVIQTTGSIEGVFKDERQDAQHERYRARAQAARAAEDAGLEPDVPQSEKLDPDRA